MLNPTEIESKKIIAFLYRLSSHGGAFSDNKNTYSELYAKMRKDREEIISLTHSYLKKEWERVKRGA